MHFAKHLQADTSGSSREQCHNLWVGTDIELFAIEPQSDYLQKLLSEVRWEGIPPHRYVKNDDDLVFMRQSSALFRAMIDADPSIGQLTVNLERRDPRMRQFLVDFEVYDRLRPATYEDLLNDTFPYEQADAGLKLCLSKPVYDEALLTGGIPLGGGSRYNPPEVVAALTKATDHIDAASLEFDDVVNSYASSPRGPLTQSEFLFFAKIVGELLSTYRTCAARSLGIISILT